MTRHATPEQRYDRERDHLKHDAPNALDRILASMPGKFALNDLLGWCDGIVRSGILGAETEPFRKVVERVNETHDMPKPVRKVEVADA